MNCGDIAGNAQKLQPPVNSTSLISAIQSKPAHWDAKIDLPFQMPQDQDALLIASRIYTPVKMPCLQSAVASVRCPMPRLLL